MAPAITLAVIMIITILFYASCCLVEAESNYKGDDIVPLPPDVRVFWLKKGDIQNITSIPKANLKLFCRRGDAKKLVRIWRHVTMHITIESDDYSLFVGRNQSDVFHKFKDSELTWFHLKRMMPWKTDTVTLDPFYNSCLGILTKEPYTVGVHIKGLMGQMVLVKEYAGHIKYPHKMFLLVFLVGVGLFFGADELSKNILFYYGSGVSLGVLASLLIVVFIVSRYFPRKYGGIAFLVGGWSFVLYFIQLLWTNLQSVLERYSQYVLGYFTVAGLLSFALCYWRGPVTNPRTLNLIKWSIQFAGLVLIYNSSQIQEVSMFCVLSVLAVHNFPRWVICSIQMSWVRLFPPKVKLLSEDEYIQQGTKETRKALEDLREYCRSPECDAWKVISRIKSPQRFAQFVEGSPHVTDTELLDYDSDAEELLQPDFTDDESEIDFRLSSQ